MTNIITPIKTAFEGVWNSFVRTAIPIVVGGAVSWLISLGIPVDTSFTVALTAFLGAIAAALFYLVVRVAEKFVPKVGLLLGVAKQPVYTTPATTTAVEAAATQAEAKV